MGRPTRSRRCSMAFGSNPVANYTETSVLRGFSACKRSSINRPIACASGPGAFARQPGSASPCHGVHPSDGTETMSSLDSFQSRKTLKVGSRTYVYYSLPAAEKRGLRGISRLPHSMKVLLENLLRNEDGRSVTKDDIKAVAAWLKKRSSAHEISFRPARVLMQDFTGVPAVVDLAAMRDAMRNLGGDANKINPLVPVDLVIDHSVIVNFFGSPSAFKKNVEEEYKQNQERYRFLKWAQRSFENFRVVPPGTGICHQVNLEYLSRTVFTRKQELKIDGRTASVEVAYPDTVIGTDSHTTMVNGLSVLGWGVGGIEAEAAMLGQPMSMVLPEVIGFRVTGRLKEGVTATDLVLTETLKLDLATVEPSLAGPKRPQDRVLLKQVKAGFAEAMDNEFGKAGELTKRVPVKGRDHDLGHGDVVIAAITSCTNTSNPSVMVGAGLLAKKAIEKGLKPKPWVKTSLAPGSQVVAEYLAKSGLQKELDQIGFNLVGFGCTTCIGNSGPLPPEISKAVNDQDLVAAAVLSGNRNFEGRVNADVRANYLASPPLVVAYALAGSMQLDLLKSPLGRDAKGKPVFLKDIWPSSRETTAVIRKVINKGMFTRKYADVFKGDANWRRIGISGGVTYAWDSNSTYVQNPPYFAGMGRGPAPLTDIVDARILGLFLDSITTDHISPAGSIKQDSPAGKYLLAHNVKPLDFNQYGTRRGNHEVMMRGTFANIRINNQMVRGVEGCVTVHYPSRQQMPIYDAAMRYKQEM